MIKIDQKLLDEVCRQSKNSTRLRQNYNFHHLEEGMQRMLNALQPGTYTQPHKHITPLKHEAFVLLQGKVAIIEYSDLGEIYDYAILSKETECFAAEITPGTWHNLLVLEENTVVYEIKDGPYNPLTDKVWAPWAPAEGNKDADRFLSELSKKILSLVD